MNKSETTSWRNGDARRWESEKRQGKGENGKAGKPLARTVGTFARMIGSEPPGANALLNTRRDFTWTTHQVGLRLDEVDEVEERIIIRNFHPDACNSILCTV